jgi:cephalosporin hydroxylase
VREYLKHNSDLALDTELCNYFGRNMTFNLDGFLRKV